MTETTPQLARGWRRRRVRLFLVLGTLLLLIGYAGLDLWAGHRVNVAIGRLEKQYGRLNEDTLRLPPAPAGDNRARVVRAAAALTAFVPGTYFSDSSNAYGRFVKAPASGPVPTDLRAFVEANRAALRVAEDGRTRRQSNWEVEYQNGGAIPAWMDIRTLSNAIYLAALLDLEAGRSDDAAKAVATGLAVSGSLRQEPDLLAQLIRISLAMQQFEAVHRVVIQSEPSKASLEELARWLVENRTPDPAHVALLSVLKYFNAALARMENGDFQLAMAGLEPFLVANGPAYDSPFWIGPLARLGRPFIRLARARYLRQFGDLLDVQAGPRPRPAFLPSAAPARWEWMRRLDTTVVGLERSIETFDRFHSALGATELAVALRRFRLDHGNYPDELSALVPVYVASLPIDPFTGQPAVYARQGAGFRLRVQGGEHVPLLMVSALDWNVPK